MVKSQWRWFMGFVQTVKHKKEEKKKGGTYVVVLVVRENRVHFDSHQAASLVSPGAGDIAHSVTTTTEDQGREIIAAHKVDAVGMAAHAQVEAAKAITRQAVSTALKDDCLGPVVGHDGINDRLEDGLVRDVCDSVTEREVDRVVLTLLETNVTQLTSAWEVLAVLVE